MKAEHVLGAVAVLGRSVVASADDGRWLSNLNNFRADLFDTEEDSCFHQLKLIGSQATSRQKVDYICAAVEDKDVHTPLNIDIISDLPEVDKPKVEENCLGKSAGWEHEGKLVTTAEKLKKACAKRADTFLAEHIKDGVCPAEPSECANSLQATLGFNMLNWCRDAFHKGIKPEKGLPKDCTPFQAFEACKCHNFGARINTRHFDHCADRLGFKQLWHVLKGHEDRLVPACKYRGDENHQQAQSTWDDVNSLCDEVGGYHSEDLCECITQDLDAARCSNVGCGSSLIDKAGTPAAKDVCRRSFKGNDLEEMTDVGQRSRGYCSFEDKREHGTDEDFRNACKCLIGKELAEKKAEQTTTTTTTTAATESTTSLTTSAVDTTTTSAVTEKTEPTTSLTTSSTTSALNTTTTAAVPEQTESTTSLTTSAVNTTTTSAVPEKTDSTTSLTTSLTTSALNASTTAAVPEKTDSTTSVTTSAVNATTTSSNGQKPTDVTTSVPAGTTTAASGSASQTGTQTTSTQTGTKATTLAPAQTSGTVVPGQKIDQIRVEAFFTFLNNDCKFEIIAGIVVPVIPAEWHDVAYSVYFCLKIKVVGDKEGKRNFEPCEARFHARVVSDIHGHLIDGHVVKYTDLSGSVEAVCVSGGVYVKVRVSIGGGQPTISETDKKAAGPGADLIDQCTGRSCSRVPGNTNVDIRFNIGPASRVPAGAAAPARNSFGLQIRISVVQCQSQQCGAIQRCLDDKCVTQTPAVGFVANVSVSIGNVRPATIESEAKCVEEIEKPAGSNGVAGKTLSGKVTVIVKAIDAVKPKICKPRPAGSKAQPKVEKPKAESNEAVPNQDVRINIAAGQDNKEKSVPSTQPEQPAQQSTTTSQRTKQETTNSKTTTETTSKQEGQNKETTTTVKLAPVDRPAAVNNTQTGPSSESGSQAPSKSGNQAPSSESGSQGPSKVPSESGSQGPSKVPSESGSQGPSKVPSESGSQGPSKVPSESGSQGPSKAPSSESGSQGPSKAPSSESGSAGPSKIPSESGSAGPSKDQDKSSPASPASPARVNSGEERPSSGSPAGGNPPSGASGASSGRPGQSQASSESDVEPATRMGGSSSGPARPATSGSAVPRPDSGSARPSTGPVSPRPSGSPLSSGSSRVVMASNFLACVVGLALFL